MALEKELNTYEMNKDDLLANAGKYVLIHVNKVAGVYDEYAKALEAGYQSFGVQPFLVKKIESVETVHHFTRLGIEVASPQHTNRD